MVVCDKWVVVKVFEVLFCIACLVCKRVTDDESIRLALYLQKLSREWSLLRNITWDSIGASFGDAVYGGYVIITFGLLLGKIFREIPSGRRVLEGFLLGFGALFFIVLGGLELASLDSIPDRLIDNAAVLGVLSLITAALFLIDLAGPRRINTSKHSQTDTQKNAFTYPKLPQDNKNDEKKDQPQTDTNSLRPKFFPDKFKKPNKKDDKKMIKDNVQDGIKENGDSSSSKPNDDVIDGVTLSQVERNGYHKFLDDNADILFEKMEKSKYGSVRNGDVKRPQMVEESVFQQMSAKPQTKYGPESLEGVIKSLREYDHEMDKNISYLKLLEDRNALKKSDRNEFEEDLAKLNETYMKEFHQQRLMQLNENKNFPRMGLSRTESEKQKQWEKFEEETLPRFPIKQDYLPEPQTPVFARIKEKSSNRNYGVYDNLSLYNIQSKSDNASQTDTLKSKTSTLRSSKPPTLQQIAEYFGLQQKQTLKADKKEVSIQMEGNEMPAVSFLLPNVGSKKNDNNINYNGGPSSPTDPGYVQYTAQQWNDRMNRKYSTKNSKT